MSGRRTLLTRLGFALLLLLAAIAALVVWLNLRGEAPIEPAGPGTSTGAATVERGAYLALAGNCAGCHTARGGAAFAGGRGLDTPYGTVYASNLTPDRETGIGAWSASEFWRAMHHGRSKDGRLLYPVFPYTSYTLVTREDSDALFAYLTSRPPVRRPDTPHALRFPYNLQASLAVWRALFFRADAFAPEPARSPDWNRGSYLVRGLGHCIACHADRNPLGATTGETEFGGGLIPMQNWYAPSLASAHEAGVADWSVEAIVALLKTGIAPGASVMGPMAEVVFRSTQHLTDADLTAMAVFMKALPPTEPKRRPGEPAGGEQLSQGGKIYAEQCAGCHGDRGQGVAGVYPALAGNRAVTLPSPNNVVKAIVDGGFPPTTAGNPRPFGMPPFGQTLADADIAAVASFLRQSWSHAASPVSVLDVRRAR